MQIIYSTEFRFSPWSYIPCSQIPQYSLLSYSRLLELDAWGTVLNFKTKIISQHVNVNGVVSLAVYFKFLNWQSEDTKGNHHWMIKPTEIIKLQLGNPETSKQIKRYVLFEMMFAYSNIWWFGQTKNFYALFKDTFILFHKFIKLLFCFSNTTLFE